MCRLSWNLAALTSWNPQGLYRPIIELFYLLPTYVTGIYLDHINISFFILAESIYNYYNSILQSAPLHFKPIL